MRFYVITLFIVFFTVRLCYSETINVQDKIRELKSSDKTVRMHAIESLGKAHDKSSTQDLMDIFKNEKDGVIREYIIDALARIGDNSAARFLLEISKDKKELNGVRIAAISALGFFNGDEVIDGAGAIAADENEKTAFREIAVRSLGMSANKKSIPVLKNVLQNSKNKELRLESVISLANTGGDESVDALSIAAKDSEPDVRKSAAISLADIGTDKAVRELEKMSSDKDSKVKLLAQEQLKRFKKTVKKNK